MNFVPYALSGLCIILLIIAITNSRKAKRLERLRKLEDAAAIAEQRQRIAREVKDAEDAAKLRIEALEENYRQKNNQRELEFSKKLEANALELTRSAGALSNLRIESENLTSKLKKQQDEFQSQLDASAAKAKELMDSNLKLYYETMVDEYTDNLNDTLDANLRDAREVYESTCGEMEEKLNNLHAQIEDERKRRDAINQEIARRREIEEKQDYFRIVISENDKDDISSLNSLRSHLHNPLFLDKMIYDNYISKPVKEMEKRVLKNKDICGIYKITNIQTQEIYVGKSTNISDRWVNHIKSACGLEGVADSMFQRALKKYGVDQWTFEVIEEIPKDKLTEREKYWITFYDTTRYGLNQKVG